MAASKTTTMASSSALVLLLLAGCLHAAEPSSKKGGDSDLVASSRVCANGTSDFCHMHLTSKYCVSTLRSDPRSARAQDARDLVLVAIDLARRGAAAADARAAAVLERMSSDREDAKRILRYCRTNYAAVAHLAAVCRGVAETFSHGNRMQMYYNLECARKLVRAAKDCGLYGLYVEQFEDSLRREFIDVARRTALVKATVEVMIGVEDPVEGFVDDFDGI